MFVEQPGGFSMRRILGSRQATPYVHQVGEGAPRRSHFLEKSCPWCARCELNTQIFNKKKVRNQKETEPRVKQTKEKKIRKVKLAQIGNEHSKLNSQRGRILQSLYTNCPNLLGVHAKVPFGKCPGTLPMSVPGAKWVTPGPCTHQSPSDVLGL